MYEPSTQPTLPGLTSYVEASPVSRIPLPEVEGPLPTTGIFGDISPASFARLDPDGLWQRMYRGCCPVNEEDTSGASSLTWPRSGLMRNGLCYPLLPSALRTVESGSSSWPTPTAHNAKETGAPSEFRRKHHLTAEANRRMWATPTVNGNYNRKGASATSGDGLATQVGGGPLNPTWVEWLMGFPAGWTDLSV